MSRFNGPLKVSFSGNRSALLLEPLVWELDEKGSGVAVTVPAGFASDGASVPRLLWWLMPPWGDVGTRAAILHDYLLILIDNGAPFPGVPNREAADWQFYLALQALGVGRVKARLCWLGVRAYSISCEKGWALPVL